MLSHSIRPSVDVIGKGVKETFGLHVEDLADDLGLERDYRIDEALGAGPFGDTAAASRTWHG